MVQPRRASASQSRRRLRHERRPNTGMALVITLAMIVLVSAAILAFFSMVTADMRVEASRSNRTRADLLAQSGGVHALGRLISEITDPGNSVATTTSGYTIYTPVSRTNVVPRRMIASGITLTDANYATLLRQSIPSADSAASSDATWSKASDGRALDTNRWSAPQLLASGFTDNSQLPNWIYVHKSTGATNAASREVIGRFAYNVYNVGGALNANAAGFRDSLTAQQFTYIKSSQSGTDLTKLGSVAQSDITRLASFRNPDAVTPAGYVDNAAGSRGDGYLSTLSTNLSTGDKFHQNFFSSRQDLLRYARTQNSGLRNITPSLTHFSRSLSAPSWCPVNPVGSSIDYAGNAESSTSPNRNIPNVRFGMAGSVTHYTDDGKAIKRVVKAGEPMVMRRFSLARLAWLTPTGPSATVFSNSDTGREAIQAVFGLRWNASQERWDYYGAETSAQSSIKTLGEIAAESTPREPNFFEMLKAGILTGSVGSALQPWVSGSSATGSDYLTYFGTEDTWTLQSNKDLQILRIGANIIDNADADNYPTVIALNFAGVPVEVAGVEDLPYLWAVMMVGLRVQDGTSPNALRLLCGDMVWVPVFLNPHRTPPSVPSTGPAAVRFQFATGVITKVDYNGAGSTYPQTITRDMSALGSITIPRVASGTSMYGFEDYRAIPKAAVSTDPNDPQRLDKLAYFTHPDTGVETVNVDAANANFKGFRIFSWQKEYTGSGKVAGAYSWYFKTPSSWVTNGYAYFTYPQQLNLVMRYQTPLGNWKTYATMGGSEALPTTGLNGTKNDGVSYPGQVIRFGRHFNDTSPLIMHNLQHCYCLFNYDPRTSRIGPTVTRFWDYGTLPPNTYTSSMGYSGPPPVYLPEAGKSSSNVTGSYGPVATNWADPDGVFRPTDGYLNGATANPYRQVSGGQYVADHASRPTLLQRPYQSVAELGYVFRDAPWKSLSFFDETSADSGLLDLFTVADEPEITAGRFDLNATLPLVKQAALSLTALDPYLGQSSYSPTLLSNSTITTTADAYSTGGSAFAYANGRPTAAIPSSVAHLANFMSAGGLSSAGLDVIKNRREAVVRGLADVSQTRTWNVLIDVVAQTGVFSAGSATTADRFVVEGEQRYWWSVSIDRYTGKIVAQQLEAVHE